MAQFTRPFMYPKQLEAMFCPERLSLIEATTKSGKTVSAMAWLSEKGFLGQAGQNFWWVSPGYNQSDIAYRRLKRGLTPGSFTSSDSPTPRITLMSGATLWFKSGDNPDALYGEDVYAVVIDEASRVKEDCWYAIRSTLTATGGPARIIGNVKGRKNWFYVLARKAEAKVLPNARYTKITATDAVQAGIMKQEEIDEARAVLPENVFRELYFAEPSDDLGNPFGLSHIRKCINEDGLAPGPVVAYGVDLAKSHDWLVIVGLNEFGQVASFSRWQGVPWKESINRIWEIIGEDTAALVDSTGAGDPVLEQLQYEHGNFEGYHFSATSKQKLMEGLAVSIQSREIGYPLGFIPSELENFEYEYTRTGVKYSAIEGQHDDCVCALALARHKWAESGRSNNVQRFYEAEVKAQAKDQVHDKAKGEPDDPRPWQMGDIGKATAEALTNELTQLYEETLKKVQPQDSGICSHCGQPIEGQTKVSDGVNSWHQDCARGVARIKELGRVA